MAMVIVLPHIYLSRHTYDVILTASLLLCRAHICDSHGLVVMETLTRERAGTALRGFSLHVIPP